MTHKLLYFCLPLLLTGCVGSLISGHTGQLDECYPDIRCVPPREEAEKSRGKHVGDEKEASAADFEKLEQDRAKLKDRNEALRAGAFQ